MLANAFKLIKPGAEEPSRFTRRSIIDTNFAEACMARSSPRQRRITGRVLHEFKHGELHTGRGGKVKSRRQAVAIALKEAGASRYESASENAKNRARTEEKEARGETYQQEREGKSHVGAEGRRESTPAMGGQDARTSTARVRKARRSRGSA